MATGSYACMYTSFLIVCEDEKFLGVTIGGNYLPKKVWMRVVQAGGNADQSDKTTASG